MKYENFNETTLLALLVMMTFWDVEGCSTFLNCLTEKKVLHIFTSFVHILYWVILGHTHVHLDLFVFEKNLPNN